MKYNLEIFINFKEKDIIVNKSNSKFRIKSSNMTIFERFKSNFNQLSDIKFKKVHAYLESEHFKLIHYFLKEPFDELTKIKIFFGHFIW